ncbi:MAG TPA: hypothetical protein VGI36_19245 [Candidatus Binataceae bacterium]
MATALVLGLFLLTSGVSLIEGIAVCAVAGAVMYCARAPHLRLNLPRIQAIPRFAIANAILVKRRPRVNRIG